MPCFVVITASFLFNPINYCMNAIIIYLLCMEWNLNVYVLNLIDENTFPCFHWPLYFQPFGFSRVPVPSNISNCHSPTIFDIFI